MASLGNSAIYLKTISTYLSPLSPKLEEVGTFPIHPMRPVLPLYQNQTDASQEKKATDQYHLWI